MKETSADDVAVQLVYADKVIFVPGFGLAHPRRSASWPIWATCSRVMASRCRTRSTRSRDVCPVT